MRHILDLDRYPLDREGHEDWHALVARSAAELERDGMFSLENLLLPQVAEDAVAQLAPAMATASFEHRRWHNIYFKPCIEELAADHPALREIETISHTLCADQIPDSIVMAVYEYPALLRFLAATMGKPVLYPMADPLAKANVIAYRHGEALNWHFDRSEFTVTLLLQAPNAGGDFQYRNGLRSEENPNYDGVAKLLQGEDPEVKTLPLKAGTLNVFRGKKTAHRVTPVQGDRERIVAVLSYYEKPGVAFSDADRIGFYGRPA